MRQFKTRPPRPSEERIKIKGMTYKKDEISNLKNTCVLGVVACGMMAISICTCLLHIGTLNTSNSVLSEKLSETIVERDYYMKKSLTSNAFRVKVTGYHPDSGGINSDSNPAMTATMTPHKAGRTCAISTELVEAGWLGKEIYVEGFGMMIANDRLAKGIKGKQIDLCKGSYNDAMAVGVNMNVLASIASRTKIKSMLEE